MRLPWFGDQFGFSVAVSGDTVVVGAILENSSTTGVDSVPNQFAPDAGAAYVFNGIGLPEIDVSGNSVNIVDDDATPALADHTDFGNVPVLAGTQVRTFTITNSGTVDLTLGSISVGGVNAADFTVSLQPSSPVAASGNTTFQVTFDPSAPGLRSATLSFTNNDSDEDPFNFSIQGTGTEVTVTPTAGLVTTEAGGTATFTVALAAPPTADVTIAVSSSDLTEGTVAPASLTFTTGAFGYSYVERSRWR